MRGTEGRAAAASLAHSEALRAASSPEGGSGRDYPRLWRGVLAESLDSGEHRLKQRQARNRARSDAVSISAYRQRRSTTLVAVRLLIDLRIQNVYRMMLRDCLLIFQRLSTAAINLVS